MKNYNILFTEMAVACSLVVAVAAIETAHAASQTRAGDTRITCSADSKGYEVCNLADQLIALYETPCRGDQCPTAWFKQSSLSKALLSEIIKEIPMNAPVSRNLGLKAKNASIAICRIRRGVSGVLDLNNVWTRFALEANSAENELQPELESLQEQAGLADEEINRCKLDLVTR
jgi:hypothetical protein